MLAWMKDEQRAYTHTHTHNMFVSIPGNLCKYIILARSFNLWQVCCAAKTVNVKCQMCTNESLFEFRLYTYLLCEVAVVAYYI
jgi:hypothetical protein